jgi:hypothetical protein
VVLRSARRLGAATGPARDCVRSPA